MRRIELFERFFKVKPQPIGDYIFDKYISSIVPDAKNIKVLDYAEGPEKNRTIYTYLEKYYVVDIEFNIRVGGYINYSERDLRNLIEIINSVKDLCIDKIKSANGVEYYFFESFIRLRLILKQDKLKEIQQSQEYQNWLSSVESQWKKYREDETLKKYAKKYNL